MLWADCKDEWDNECENPQQGTSLKYLLLQVQYIKMEWWKFQPELQDQVPEQALFTR